jgi:hypothetical protein
LARFRIRVGLPSRLIKPIDIHMYLILKLQWTNRLNPHSWSGLRSLQQVPSFGTPFWFRSWCRGCSTDSSYYSSRFVFRFWWLRLRTGHLTLRFNFRNNFRDNFQDNLRDNRWNSLRNNFRNHWTFFRIGLIEVGSIDKYSAKLLPSFITYAHSGFESPRQSLPTRVSSPSLSS